MASGDGIPDVWPDRIAAMFGPYRGRCGFCGDFDARHRLVDSAVGMVLAGETVETAADELDLAPDAVRAAVDHARARLGDESE